MVTIHLESTYVQMALVRPLVELLVRLLVGLLARQELAWPEAQVEH